MAYSELVKNFNRIRDYMREFYVYGFKSRDEYTRKSARSYDNERRRLESWLGDYMQFRRTADGKNVFLSIDSRLKDHNPLHRSWKTKSFTDGDITLHFILFDILNDPEIWLSLSEITEKIDEYLEGFDEPKLFDESTVRKKLKEYVSEGIVRTEKRGRIALYSRAKMEILPSSDVLNFFSEILPCGVIGSFLLDKMDASLNHFTFKHHYITGTMDSEVKCLFLSAVREKRYITIENTNRKKGRSTETLVVPLKLMISSQSGREYLMVYSPDFRRIIPFRADNVVSVKTGEICKEYDEYAAYFEGMLPHLWGVSTQSISGNRLEHVEFTVRYKDNEMHIRQRLEREKRCGIVTHIDSNTSRFSADVFDTSELVPWIRTFICRITEIHFSNDAVEKRFKEDLKAMYELYGIGGGE